MFRVRFGVLNLEPEHELEPRTTEHRTVNRSVVISSRGEQRVRGGHPWIYRTDVVDVSASGGDMVEVIGPRHRRIGYALFSDRSQITLRMLTRGDEPAGEPLVRARLERALGFRKS